MADKVVREPIATWWKIDRYRVALTPLQVVSFTGSFVTFLEKSFSFSGVDKWRERRERRDDILPTFDEAKAEAVRRAENEVAEDKERLHRSRTKLGQVQSLTPPNS